MDNEEIKRSIEQLQREHEEEMRLQARLEDLMQDMDDEEFSQLADAFEEVADTDHDLAELRTWMLPSLGPDDEPYSDEELIDIMSQEADGLVMEWSRTILRLIEEGGQGQLGFLVEGASAHVTPNEESPVRREIIREHTIDGKHYCQTLLLLDFSEGGGEFFSFNQSEILRQIAASRQHVAVEEEEMFSDVQEIQRAEQAQ
jgi:hypothetical protein